MAGSTKNLVDPAISFRAAALDRAAR